METKVVVRALVGDSRVNRFMRGCDISSEYKYFGELKEFVVTYKNGEKVNRDRLTKLLVNFMNGFEQIANIECVFSKIVGITNKTDISDLFLIKNGFEKVKIISDGKYETFIEGLEVL